MPSRKKKPARASGRASDIQIRAALGKDSEDLKDARARMKERGSVPWSKVKKDLGL